MNEADLKDVSDVRQRFYAAARAMYPNVADPGALWVVTQVLGWTDEEVNTTSVEGFGREGYRRFIKDADGMPVIENGAVKAVTRKWTKAEKSKLKEWWWLLGL